MKASSTTQKVVITGADGFIGKELVKSLLGSGADVFPITRNSSNNVSLFDADSLRIFINDVKPNTVVHLANRKASTPREDDLISIHEGNIKITENLILAVASSKSKAHFIQIGSCAEYGAAEAPYRELATPVPMSDYGMAKLSITNHLISVSNLIDWTVLRPSVVFGPGQAADMFIPSVVHAMKTNSQINLTSCTQNRDFIYISDIVGGIMSTLLNRDVTSGHVINLASGNSHILRNVALKIANFFPPESVNNLNFGSIIMAEDDVSDYRVDISKAKQLIGWKPLIDLDLGLKKVVNG